MFGKQFLPVWLGFLVFAQLHAQTRINLPYHARNVDFSAAPSTKPFKTGTMLPSTCEVGEGFFKSDGEAGQNFYGCTSTNQWTLQSGGSGGSGSAGPSSALTDLRVTRTSNTTLTIGSSCSTAAPCNYRLGHVVIAITNPLIVTLASASNAGTAYIFISSSNSITVGHSSTLTVNCSVGCFTQTGVEQFPDDSLPLFRWTANTEVGKWDASGGTDYRAFLAWTPLAAGLGLSRTINPLTGENTFAADPNVIGVRVSVPQSSTSTCVAGNWAADTQYLYLCAAPNVWRRVATQSW
jgi:hypothetical protein